jgi:hypothetical protein
MKNACRNLNRKLKEKRLPGRPRRRWEENIEIDHKTV